MKSVNHTTIQGKLTSELSQNKIKRKKAEHTRLKVTFPDGRIINEHVALNTFIETIQEFGFEKVKEISESGGISIISERAYNGLKKPFQKIPNTPFYINSNNSTGTKKMIIEKIANMLSVDISVEIVAK